MPRALMTRIVELLILAAVQICIHLVVHKCVYALQEDQQLQEIASLYSTDWLNLYRWDCIYTKELCA